MRQVSIGLILALVAGAASVPMLPGVAGAVKGERFLFSAYSLGEGKATLGLGGRVLTFLPMFDFNFGYGLTDRLDLETRVSTLGVLNLADAGVKGRILGDQTLSFGARADLSLIGLVLPTGGQEEGTFGLAVMPGLLLSFGARWIQVTLGLDAPLFFVGGSEVASGVGTSNFAWSLRPSLSFEMELTEDSNLYLQGQVILVDTTVADDSGATRQILKVFGPMLAIGAGF